MPQMTAEQQEALIKAMGEKTWRRMTYLMGGGRERVTVSKDMHIVLFYETWFEWGNNQSRPIKGYVVSDPYDSQTIQHRFEKLSEADKFFEALLDKYAVKIGLYALGIDD